MTEIKITISIVSHLQSVLVQNLLNSLDQHLIFTGCKIKVIIRNNKPVAFNFHSSAYDLIVVDNASEKGFGSNHNLNFSMYDSDLFLILNPDIIFNSQFDLFELAIYLDERTLGSPNVLRADYSPEDFFRPDVTPLELLGRHGFKNYTRGKGEWLSGAFLVLRSSLFLKLGGFDENFFMYVEDCELSKRVLLSGGVVRILENFEVLHLAQRDSNKLSRNLFMHIRSLFYYWFKCSVRKIFGVDIGRYPFKFP